MSISSSTLGAIQKLGTQAHAAKESLLATTNQYAEKVNAAMKKNPHDPAVAGLQAAWLSVAQIAKSMETIESELVKAYTAANRLMTNNPLEAIKIGAQAVKEVAAEAYAKVNGKKDKPLNKPAPNTKTKAAVAAAVDVPTEKAKKKAAAKKPATKTAKVVVKQAPKGSNPEKLFKQLEMLLNGNDFVEVNQSEVAKAAGIPNGSMTAAFKKLIDTGRIIVGEKTNAFKLPAPVSTVEG